MEKVIFFPYSWHVNENEQNTQIRIFGLTQKNKSICVTVSNFTPYIYIELPEKINWTSVKATMVGNKIDSLCGKRIRRDGTICFRKNMIWFEFYSFPYVLQIHA